MTQSKAVISAMLALIFLAAQVLTVGAAPAVQTATMITGEVQSITVETDANGVQTVVVEILDETGATQMVRLSVEDALALGLVEDDGSGNYVPVDSAIGTTVQIDPAVVIQDDNDDDDGEHPVGSSLANFFSGLFGVDYDIIMDYHTDGVGFGVIAQALWMTFQLDGDTDLFAAILDAKQSGDYSAVTLPDGSTPTNWGQFRKAVLADVDKAKNNLGAVMSGKADDDGNKTNNGQGQDKDKGKDKDKDKDNNLNNGNGKDNDNAKGKDNNNGKGKDKDKGKDN